jgi:hypothetical protein
MKSKNFKVTIDEKEVEMYVVTPSSTDQKEGNKVFQKTFNEALKNGSVVRARLDDLLIEQGLWDEKKQIEFNTLQRQILDAERALDKGGIPLVKAREIAIQMKRDRGELRELISVKTSLDSHSAEGQAESERFNYYVYACTYYSESRKRVFETYEDYLNKNTEELAIRSAQNLANLLYGLEEDFESKLPENEFLLKYKFVDKDLRFINKEGKLVDFEGRLINENGRFIDEEGNYVDKYGNRMDEDGNYEVDFQPFTDENGKPVLLEGEENVPAQPTESETKKKSKPRKTEE